MGWKGTVRSLVAASRVAEREAQRRHKQEQKEQTIAESASAVSDWEGYIDDLVSIHTDMADKMDWHAMANQPKPVEPPKKNKHEDRARAALSAFKPSFFHLFRGGSTKVKLGLKPT